jgi:cytosine permease
MNNVPSQPTLPSYITSAVPNPPEKRAPWYKNTAPTYAGIFLWFVFWQQAVATKQGNLGGSLAQGVGWALVTLVFAALVCHFLFYLVPGLFGMKTGLPLYIVGTSTFGAQGGFIMPGFLMGVLQFGWLGVNTYFSSVALEAFTGIPSRLIMVVWAVLAAFVGLKGIQYVARVATYLPLIPLAILLYLLVNTIGGLAGFEPAKLIAAHQKLAANAPEALGLFGVLAFMLTYVVGFFATAGAAGVDFGLNNRDKKDVQMGGLVGITLAIVVTAGLWILIVAGSYGSEEISKRAVELATAQKGNLPLAVAAPDSPSLIAAILGSKAAGVIMFLLALAAFPPACFSSFIAANSFKTTLPKVNPFVSVGIGAAVSIVLAVTEQAGKAVTVFEIIGASFGPICGAMMVDYLLNHGQWTGPRAGFNPAGWIAWALGFIVGILPVLGVAFPAAPVAAFIVGAVVYFICAKAGLLTQVVPLPAASSQAGGAGS